MKKMTKMTKKRKTELRKKKKWAKKGTQREGVHRR